MGLQRLWAFVIVCLAATLCTFANVWYHRHALASRARDRPHSAGVPSRLPEPTLINFWAGGDVAISLANGRFVADWDSDGRMFVCCPDISSLNVDRVLFIPVSLESGGPAVCSESRQFNSTCVLCLNRMMSGVSGVFQAMMKRNADQLIPTGVFVEIGNVPRYEGVSGCVESAPGAGDCLSGSILTLHGTGVDDEDPSGNLLLWLPVGDEWGWDDFVSPTRRPTCAVKSATPVSLTCILHIPLTVPSGSLFSLVASRARAALYGTSPIIIKAGPPPPVTPLQVVAALGCAERPLLRHHHPLPLAELEAGQHIFTIKRCLMGDTIVFTTSFDIIYPDGLLITFEPLPKRTHPGSQGAYCIKITTRRNSVLCSIAYKSNFDVFTSWKVEIAYLGIYLMARDFILEFNVRRDRKPYDSFSKLPGPCVADSQRSSALGIDWIMYENVSVVYTFVNGSKNSAPRTLYGGRDKKKGSEIRDSNELFYSVRSLHKYMPWHKGMIYFVTPEGHEPTWLNASHPRVKHISQDLLIPKWAQPTFSSNELEPFLHRIPNIGPYYIHMNDDYFFLKPTHPCDFFLKGGGVKLYFTPDVISFDSSSSRTAVWQRMTARTWDIIEQEYGPTKRHYLHHAPFNYHTGAFPHLLSRYGDHFNRTLRHKFRHFEDVITPLLHHYFVINEGEAYGMFHSIAQGEELNNLIFIGITDNTTEALLYLAKWFGGSSKGRFTNINDLFTNDNHSWIIEQTLAYTFLEPSPFELKGSQRSVPLPPESLHPFIIKANNSIWLSNSPPHVLEAARGRSTIPK